MREDGPLIEALTNDYPPAMTLLQSLTVADAQPAHLGTPRHLEQVSVAILCDLES